MAAEAYEQHGRGEIVRREDAILRRLGRNLEAANDNVGFKQEKLDDLSKSLKKAQKVLKGSNGELNELEQALEKSDLQDESQIERAEELLRTIILKEAEKKLRGMRDQDEDELLSLSNRWLKKISTYDIKKATNELSEIDKIKNAEEKHKRKVEKLKRQSPRAFKAYVKAVAEDEKHGSIKGRSGVLKDIESTYKDAIKAPLAVQGEFFKMIEMTEEGDLEQNSFEKTLDKLQREYEKMAEEYEGMINQNEKIFGRKPAQEFKKWIRERKNFEEMKYAQHVLETEYIPERRQLQAKFEALPQSLTQQHEQKWYEELGYSERKALMDSFEKMEHQKDNPLAQEYLKLLTDSPKEIATKEWPKMTEEFAKLNYNEQESYLKAYPLMEGKERKKLTDRFEALSQKTRDANKDFFTQDKEEKIILLKALEKDAENESGTQEWEDVVLDTEKGMSVFGDKLRMVFGGTQGGEAVMLADLMAKKTYEAQMILGVTSAEKRQAKTLGAKAGKEAEEKATMIHEITKGETTVDDKTAQEEEFHTMDMMQLRRGGVERTELENIKTEILKDRAISSNKDKRYNRARFVSKAGEREFNLSTETEQRRGIEQMVQDKIVQALIMTIEAMTGQKISGEKEKDLAEMAERRSEALLGKYRQMTKQRFDLEGLSTMKKAA